MFGLFNKQNRKNEAAHIYTSTVEHARSPFFYQKCQVPDTVDGRFELMVVHVFCVFYVLKQNKDKTEQDFSQEIFDIIFTDMDRSLREAGVGDLGVPKHIKRMTTGLNGRVIAYEQGVDAHNPIVLCQALDRNLYGTVDDVTELQLAMMADYMRAQIDFIKTQSIDDIMSGKVAFIEPDDIYDAHFDPSTQKAV